MPRSYLIQLSSGLDSLGAFYALMKDSPPEDGSTLIFLHIQLRDTFRQAGQTPLYPRWAAQLECAVQQYRHILKTFGDKYVVRLITPVLYPDMLTWAGWDIGLIHPITMNLAVMNNCDYITSGRTLASAQTMQWYLDNAPDHPWTTIHTQTEVEGAPFDFWKVIEFAYTKGYQRDVERLFPASDYSSEDLLRIIPRKLHETLWICERPTHKQGIIWHCRGACVKCARKEAGKIYNDIRIKHTQSVIDNHLAYLHLNDVLHREGGGHAN